MVFGLHEEYKNIFNVKNSIDLTW